MMTVHGGQDNVRQMPRARFLAMAGLPLLATLLVAQAPPLPPKKPAAIAAPKKTTPAAQPTKPEAKKPEAKKPAPKKYAIEDYRSLWDVTAETTRADIVKRFGEPQRVAGSSRKPYYYFNDTLAFFFTKEDTVATMIVGNSFERIPPQQHPARDHRKGLHRPQPRRRAQDVRPGQWSVVGKLPLPAEIGRVLKVEFQCYDVNGYVCEQVLVQF